MPLWIFRDLVLVTWCITLFLDDDFKWLRWWCCGAATTFSLIGLGWVR